MRAGPRIDQRFIPTHVGNAPHGTRGTGGGAVHPHARGERTDDEVKAVALAGSSPRTWGTPRPQLLDADADRFIPTHVGNATDVELQINTCAVHPHARGERVISSGDVDILSGSSPRTWGTPSMRAVILNIKRFIPTHVGNAVPKAPGLPRLTVHPHARGEREEPLPTPVDGSGSSPRTWGTRRRRAHAVGHVRFIPTHVGNATELFTLALRGAVHPHARGERASFNTQRSRNLGSSPRTWGTPNDHHHQDHDHRFIPTHVGNAAVDS